MVYSRDGGVSWSHEVAVSDAGNQYASGPDFTIASNGTIYVSFQELDNDCVIDCPGPPRLYLDRSTDGGQTWGTDMLIGGAAITPGGASDKKGREWILVGGLVDGSVTAFRIFQYPSIVVSPTDPNTVYAVWNDGRWDSTFKYFQHAGQHSDIAFSRTTDGGQSWSSPSRINDDTLANGVDQFQPTIAVRSDGTLGVSWYDRRNDPQNYLYDLYYSQSADGGLTWSSNRRVTDVFSNPIVVRDYKGVGDLGYFKPLIYGPDYALTGWVDGRGSSAQNYFVDRGPLATPVSTLTPTSTPTPVVDPSPTNTPTAMLTNTPTNTPTTVLTLTPTSTLTPDHTPTETHTATSTPTFSTSVTPSPTAESTDTPTGTPTTVASETVTSTATPTPTECTITFTDVSPSDYFYVPVQYLYCHGAISGYADNTFRPSNNTTRGQVSKIVVLAEGLGDLHTSYSHLHRCTSRPPLLPVHRDCLLTRV